MIKWEAAAILDVITELFICTKWLVVNTSSHWVICRTITIQYTKR